MTDQIAGHQPEFWKTIIDETNASFYPQINNGFHREFKDYAYNTHIYRRFRVQRVVNLRFTKAVGKQELTYDDTDEKSFAFILFIEEHPPEGSIQVCWRFNTQLFSFGSAGRHNADGF